VVTGYDKPKQKIHYLMRARGYSRQIEVWQTTPSDDGFGGDGVTTALLGKSWCNIKTPSKDYRTTAEGITETNNILILTLRKRNDLVYNSENMFFVYKTVKYVISSEPVNVGFEDRDIEIIITSG
jgi:hypothetical protein